jgi:hypothetical protein
VTALAPQLARIEAELAEARRRVHALVEPLDETGWSRRPAPGEWSVAECLIHLNLTSRAFLPLIEEAITRGREQGLVAPGPYRRDFVGWVLAHVIEPPVPIRTKTTAPFVPPVIEPKRVVLEAFDRLQGELGDCLSRASGLDLARLRVVSPFDARIKYNLYSCLTIIPAHQRLHLAQAERVIRQGEAHGRGSRQDVA